MDLLEMAMNLYELELVRPVRPVRVVKQCFTSQLVNCIDIYIPMINNSVELIRPVSGSRNKHVKDNAGPKAQNTMNIPRSQSVRTEQRYTYAVLFGVLLFKEQNTVNILRSQSMRTQQRCIFPRAQNTVNMLRSQSVISSKSSRALHTLYTARTLRSHKTL